MPEVAGAIPALPILRADRRTSLAASTCGILAASVFDTATPVVVPSAASTVEGIAVFSPLHREQSNPLITAVRDATPRASRADSTRESRGAMGTRFCPIFSSLAASGGIAWVSAQASLTPRPNIVDLSPSRLPYRTRPFTVPASLIKTLRETTPGASRTRIPGKLMFIPSTA